MRVRTGLAMFVLLAALLIPATTAGASVCVTTDFSRDNRLLTARLVDPATVTGEVDATGCDIGVYTRVTTSVDGSDIHGALYFGLLANGPTASLAVSNSAIHDIGDTPQNGNQRGIGISARSGAALDVTSSAVSRYQKGGVVITGAGTYGRVSDTTVAGAGAIDWIAQNGIQVSFGASATLEGNTISGNDYTPRSWVACGILYYEAAGVRARQNHFSGNELNVCNFGGRGGGHPAE